jgi:hypothetical protein
MKKIWILCLVLAVMSCKKESKTNAIETSITHEKTQNFDWLLGQWKRLDEEQNKETFENWIKYSDTEYLGIGFTMQNNDTIKQEHIKLKKTGQNWNLTVKTPEETEAIIFKMTSNKANEFICENKEIDFPKKIKYWKNDENIHASVSNAEINIPFKFEKLKE